MIFCLLRRSWKAKCVDVHSLAYEEQPEDRSAGFGQMEETIAPLAAIGAAADVEPNGAVLTTVMMRNIPNNYTREMLMLLMNGQGFKNCFDFLYLPVDFKTETGLGYSFINFNTPEDAERFRAHFQGFTKWAFLSEKVCEVSWSDVLQGLHAHVERYRNSPVMHDSVPDEFKPALYKHGERVQFPPPTKKIRAPWPWSRRDRAR